MKWAVAIGATMVAALARLVFWPELFRDTTYLPFFCAVLLAAWYGGLAPGLLSLASGAVIVAWGVFPPLENFAIANPSSRIGMGMYLAFGAAISVSCHSLHAARQRQRAIQAELHERDLHRVKMQAEAEQLAAEAQRKDQFLATVAHELRNPLAPVRYAVEIARRDPKQASEALATINRQISHLNRLIEDLVDFNRIARARSSSGLRRSVQATSSPPRWRPPARRSNRAVIASRLRHPTRAGQCTAISFARRRC